MTEYELQINQLEANADYLRKELARLQEIYCSMVESRAVLYFEKEVFFFFFFFFFFIFSFFFFLFSIFYFLITPSISFF